MKGTDQNGGIKEKVSPGRRSFEKILNESCGRLKDMQVLYSISRIDELERQLDILEQELSDFLASPGEGFISSGNGAGGAHG